MSVATVSAPDRIEAPRRPSTERPLRRVEVVTTRAQRRARPRVMHAVIAVGGVFAIFIAQLLLSIAVSNGAYTISSLQGKNAALERTQQSLTEKEQVLSSAQNLDERATKLNMVPGASNTARLDLSNGTVTGTAHAAKSGSGSAGACGLVPNANLTDLCGKSTASSAPTQKATKTTVASTPPTVNTH